MQEVSKKNQTSVRPAFRPAELTLMALFLSLLIIGAYLRIPLGFMTVTLQLVFANLAGLVLGARRSFFLCLSYLFMGLLGLPVFAGGAGPAYVLRPTFGYIVGFTVAVLIGGLLFRDRQADSLKHALFYTLFIITVCYLIGAFHYHMILNFYLDRASSLKDTLVWAVLATLPKDLILGVASSAAAVQIKKYCRVRKAFRSQL